MSLTRNQINEIRDLHQSAGRAEAGLFIAEGEKVVGELLRSGITVKYVVSVYDNAGQLSEQIPPGIPVYPCSIRDLERISRLTTPNRILAVARIPARDPSFFGQGKSYLLLDGISDPGNMGTLIRTAEWFGISGIMCSENCVDVWNPKVVQGAMGSLFRMPVVTGNAKELLTEAASSGIKNVIAADLGGEELDVSNHSLDSFVLIIGSESHGISAELLKSATKKIRIPGAGAESLNAAVAAGILLYSLTNKKAGGKAGSVDVK